MGTVPTPPTWTAGEKPTAAKMNQVRDLFNFLTAPPSCAAYQGTTATTLTTSGTVYPIGLDTEIFDVVQSGDTAMHDNATNNSRLVARTAGKYRIGGQIAYVSNATGIRALNIRVNAAGNPASGTLIYSTQVQSLTSGTAVVTGEPFLYPLAVGDYIEMFGQQTSGGSLATSVGIQNTFLWMEWRSS